jgi:hypothetical protein
MPDVIVKAAVDVDLIHVEAGAFYRYFQMSYVQQGFGYGQPYAPGLPRISANAVGGEINTIIGLTKEFRVIGTSFFGNGTGRYLGGLGPDLVLKVDNSPNQLLYISPVFGFGAITGVECEVTPETQLAGYFGFDQFDANAQIDPTNPTPNRYDGFGWAGSNIVVGSANNNNRYIREISLDMIQTIWKSTGHGALQWGVQYSYVDREAFFVAAGAPADASLNMFYTDIKYILP